MCHLSSGERDRTKSQGEGRGSTGLGGSEFPFLVMQVYI